MKHNDYIPIGECPLCKKPIYSPVYWNSKDYNAPRVPTCQHKQAEGDRILLQRRREES